MSYPIVSNKRLRIYRGDDYDFATQINNADGTPTNLLALGSTFTAQARSNELSPTSYAFTVDATAAATGRLVISMARAVTATLPDLVGFDIQVLGSKMTTLLTGLIDVEGQWTQ